MFVSMSHLLVIRMERVLVIRTLRMGKQHAHAWMALRERIVLKTEMNVHWVGISKNTIIKLLLIENVMLVEDVRRVKYCLISM